MSDHNHGKSQCPKCAARRAALRADPKRLYMSDLRLSHWVFDESDLRLLVERLVLVESDLLLHA